MSARPNEHPIPLPDTDERTLLALIRHMGRTLEDIEKLRIQHDHRRGAFQREHQIVLPPDSVLDALAVAERGAILELKRLWRQHRLAPWAKEQIGVGEKQIARLIAEIGSPHLLPDGTERTVSQLWAYCGFDPNRKRRKGMNQAEALACGNPHAKTRAVLIAQKCVMFNGAPDKNGQSRARSPFRDVYDARRAATADREWTDGHKHNDALRIVAKQFLKELWIASRQRPHEAHPEGAGGN